MTTVLIVDDHPANLMALEVVLEPAQLDVLTAKSGEEALETVRNVDLALIMTDLHMRGMSGAELVRRVRGGARNSDVPIIIVSGVDVDDPTVRKSVSEPGVAFLQKPYTMQRLQTLMDSLSVPHGDILVTTD